MYQGPDFELFCTDALGWCYYLDSNEMVQRQYQPRPVRSIPSNFSEFECKWGRSAEYAGLQQTYSTSSNFVDDVAKILRHMVYNYGSEAVLKLRIYKLNKQFGAGMVRELFFESEFDLSKYDRQQDYVASLLMEGDPEKTFKAGESTDFEIDVDDDPEAVDWLADGILFKNIFNYQVLPYQIPLNNDYFLPVVYLNRDGITDATILSSTCNYQPVLAPADLTADVNWMFKLLQSSGFTYRIYGSIKFKNNSGSASNFGYQYRDNTGTVYFSEGSTSYPAGSENELTFDEIVTIPLLVISALSFFFQVIPGQADFELLESNIKIAFDYRYRPNIRKALPADVLAKRILAKIFGYTPTLQSNLLTVDCDLLFTCGDSIRGLPSGKIKINWKKFFRFIHMRYCAGFDLTKDANGKAIAILERRIDFYKDEEIVNSGEAADFSDTIADDLLFNEIHIGYPDQDYGEVNGRGEFNVTHKYSTPIKRTIKTLDLLTQIRADMLGIEITRINLQNKSTTDSSSDNDTFALVREPDLSIDLVLSPDPFYRLDRSLNASATGLIHAPSAFNLKLSPKACLLNHGWYLRSCLFYQAAQTITYQTSDKNADLVYTDANGATITEKGDVSIATLPAAVFMPHVFNIVTAAPDNTATLLTPKPKGYIAFSANGRTWKGFPLDVGIRPVTEEEQTWKLLPAAGNDLKKLI